MTMDASVTHQEEIAGLTAENKRLRKAVAAVIDLINESHGVAGLHMNGDVAPWDELRTGGRFEDWLRDFDIVVPDMEDDIAIAEHMAIAGR